MPEGDTVFQTAQRLNRALAGQEITRFDIRVPGSATADLSGRRIEGVASRGKHLLLHAGDATLHSHLKMEGEWHLYRPGDRWRAPAFRARAIVGTRVADAVGFDLAMVEVLPRREEDRVVGHLGPDLLGPDWDPDRAAAALTRDARPVHVALQDQRNLAGLGNEYVNELLFLRGILPTRPADEVDQAALVATASRLILTNRDRTVRTFTGNDRPGRRRWVYRREGRPCLRCGTVIQGGTLGSDPTRERIVFWCPSCQR